MLTCLTNEDALRLIRKVTQKSFFTQLMQDLQHKSDKLEVREEQGEWSCVSSLHHQLTRSLSCRGEFSRWAMWSDFETLHPLFMASWYWWQPLLQGALDALQLPQVRSQSLMLAESDNLWTAVAAIHTRGVDEIYVDGELAARLEPLPVAVQPSSAAPKDCLSLNPKPIAIEAADWYQLFRLLLRLSDELCTGHRVDFNQDLQSADQALDRLLRY